MNYYAELTGNLATAKVHFGNDHFKEQNGTLTYRMDTATVNGLSADLTKDSYSGPVENAFRTADLSLALTGGKFSTSFNFRPSAAALADGEPPSAGMMCGFDLLYTVDTTGSPEQSKIFGEFHWKNQFQVKLDASSITKKTSEAPKTAPVPALCMEVDTFGALLSSTFMSNTGA